MDGSSPPSKGTRARGGPRRDPLKEAPLPPVDARPATGVRSGGRASRGAGPDRRRRRGLSGWALPRRHSPVTLQLGLVADRKGIAAALPQQSAKSSPPLVVAYGEGQPHCADGARFGRRVHLYGHDEEIRDSLGATHGVDPELDQRSAGRDGLRALVRMQGRRDHEAWAGRRLVAWRSVQRGAGSRRADRRVDPAAGSTEAADRLEVGRTAVPGEGAAGDRRVVAGFRRCDASGARWRPLSRLAHPATWTSYLRPFALLHLR